MADCVRLEDCPFFRDQMINMPATAETMKKVFCHGDYSQCARYAVFKALGNGKTPSDLFPNNMLRAQEYIRKNK